MYDLKLENSKKKFWVNVIIGLIIGFVITISISRYVDVSKIKINPTENSAYLVEGLASYEAGYVRKAYASDLEALGYVVHSVPYTFKGVIKAALCIGHSFGGGRLMRADVHCKVMITMDARSWKSSMNDKYVTTQKIHHNYYQSGMFSGHPIKGAMNTNITGVSHIGLPKKVKSQVMEGINANR